MAWGWKWWLVFLSGAALLAVYGSLSIQLESAVAFFLAHAPKLGFALLALFLGRIAVDLATGLASKAVRQPELQGVAKGAASSLAWLATALLIINIFIGDISTLLLAFGLVCFGIALALQRPIMCAVGWMAIISSRLYKVGDRVRISGTEGDVAAIRLLSTTIRASSEGAGTAVSIPNSSVLEGPVANFTRDFPYVWDEIRVAIPAGIQMKDAKKALFQACDDVIGNRKMAENLKELLAGLKAAGITAHRSAPETEFYLTETGLHATLRYLVHARMRHGVRSMLSERIISSLSSPAPKNRRGTRMHAV